MTHRRRKLAGFMTIIMFYIFSMIRKVNEWSYVKFEYKLN